MIHWLTTAPNPNSPATGFDAGQRGWRLHAVEAPEDLKSSGSKGYRAVCGVRPAHGWSIDMFIERRCDRCVQKLGISTPSETYARQQAAKWRKPRMYLVGGVLIDIVKNIRVEAKEDAYGRVRERTVTTWDVVKSGGEFLSTWDTKRDALASLKQLSADALRTSDEHRV